MEDFDEVGEEVFQSSEWLKSIKNESLGALERSRSPTNTELFDLKLGKRPANSEPGLGVVSSDDSNKRKRIE